MSKIAHKVVGMPLGPATGLLRMLRPGLSWAFWRLSTI